MKRVFPVVVGGLLAAALGAGFAGCRQSTPAAGGAASSATTPATGSPATPAGAPSAAAPAAGSAPGTAQPGAPPAAPPVKPVPATLPKIVAKVGGESVEAWELESAVKQAEVNAGKPVPPEQRDSVLRSVLDELVTYHLLAQEARAEKLAVSDMDIDAQIKMIRDMFPTEEAYTQALAARGLTPDRLRQQERRALEYQKVLQVQVESRVAVQDMDVDNFYQQNIDKFKQGETIHASHIFFPVAQSASAPEKDQARAKATQALKELKAGGDFAALAKKYSADATAEQGGDLGFFGKEDLPPDFEAVAWGLKNGTTSGVVELGAGFHIIKVHERRAPRTAPLTEVRDQVKAFLVQGQRQTLYQQFLEQTKGKIKIEILV
jgi:peptidyl-prolyl cis-trans isomerase C